MQAHAVSLQQDPDQGNFSIDFNELPEDVLNILYAAMESKDRELSFTEAMNSADAAKWKHACEDEIKQHPAMEYGRLFPAKKACTSYP